MQPICLLKGGTKNYCFVMEIIPKVLSFNEIFLFTIRSASESFILDINFKIIIQQNIALTLSQTTNNRLYQSERVCRQQFKV